MNDKPRYIIPKGTAVKTRNVMTELRLQNYVTRNELQFDECDATGDGGFIYFFQNRDWLICVNAEDVNHCVKSEFEADEADGAIDEGFTTANLQKRQFDIR